jgi:hypothetical protein
MNNLGWRNSSVNGLNESLTPLLEGDRGSADPAGWILRFAGPVQQPPG